MQKHHREKDAQKTARIVHVKSEGQGTSILGMWLVEMENTERNFRITKKKIWLTVWLVEEAKTGEDRLGPKRRLDA